MDSSEQDLADDNENEESYLNDDDIGDDPDEGFSFETDHLALRGNADYEAVLRTMVILQAQKIQACKDHERIAIAKREALDDPAAFIERLTKGIPLDLPGKINIVELPKINFDKYGCSFPETSQQPGKSNSEPNNITVRGRTFDQSKPETFNQLWTCEEQKRLEELLIEYPPEPIELRRYAKIARALGNRTTSQVASRLQKYFKKLRIAGMPIPGRIPKSSRYGLSKSQRIIKQALRPTTFFPANQVPFRITDDDDSLGVILDPNYYRKGFSTISNDSNDESYQGECNNQLIVDNGESDGDVVDGTTEQQKLKLLKRIKRDFVKNQNKSERPYCEHNGFKCDICNEEPIIGTRWHCSNCIQTSIDFCSDCLVTQLNREDCHPLDHKLIGIRTGTATAPLSFASTQFSDGDVDSKDANSDDLTDYSYLDC